MRGEIYNTHWEKLGDDFKRKYKLEDNIFIGLITSPTILIGIQKCMKSNFFK